MNKTNILHLVYALVMQGIGYFATGSLWIGAAFACGFFISREHAQEQVDIKIRTGVAIASQNPLQGFVWGRNLDRWLDALFPCATLLIAYFLVIPSAHAAMDCDGRTIIPVIDVPYITTQQQIQSIQPIKFQTPPGSGPNTPPVKPFEFPMPPGVGVNIKR